MKKACRAALPYVALFALALFQRAEAQIYQLAEMNTEEIAQLDRSTSVVIIPGGILEEHGPYLPSFSDGYMNQRLARALADEIVERPGWSAVMFPQIPLGTGGANEIGRRYTYSGSYTVRMATLRSVFMDIATELGDQGFRWIFVVHIHGGSNHNRALDQAGDYFHDLYGGEMINLYGVAEGPTPNLRTEAEKSEDGISLHSGMDETSLIMFLRPDLVDPTVSEAPSFSAFSMEELVAIARSEEWPGYFGSPRLASAAHGAQSWSAFEKMFVDLAIRILDGFDYRQLPRYTDIMGGLPEIPEIDRDALDRDAAILRQQQDWLAEAELE